LANWFIIIIYLAFISLGLPDSLLGSAWPIMRIEMNMQLGAAGIVSMVISAGTIISSMNGGRLIKKLGTGKITLISCIMTAISLLGYSLSPSFIWLVLLAIPLGLGAGAVDSALNYYVAENYEAHHMNWLHSFWGLGATAGPLVMAYFISTQNSWRTGYFAISMVQFTLVIVLFAALPMWGRVSKIRGKGTTLLGENSDNSSDTERNRDTLKIKGVKHSLMTFLVYCGVEAMVGLWGASYLVGSRNMTKESAAVWVSLYYGGITLGRVISGFITLKIDNRHLVLYGQIIALLGGIALLLPLPIIFAQISFILVGLGLAPVFPGLLHETSSRFGNDNAAKLMGFQMASAYTGTTFLPPLFGWLATKFSINLFPIVVFVLLGILLVVSERIVHVIKEDI